MYRLRQSPISSEGQIFALMTRTFQQALSYWSFPQLQRATTLPTAQLTPTPHSNTSLEQPSPSALGSSTSFHHENFLQLVVTLTRVASPVSQPSTISHHLHRRRLHSNTQQSPAKQQPCHPRILSSSSHISPSSLSGSAPNSSPSPTSSTSCYSSLPFSTPPATEALPYAKSRH